MTDVWPAEYEAIYHGPDNFFAVAVRTAQDEKIALAGDGEHAAPNRSESGRLRRIDDDGSD